MNDKRGSKEYYYLENFRRHNTIPIISVVIPLFNKYPYIARALTSVLCQTLQDFEVIVVDDGSTDNGAEIVRGFRDQRIRLIQQKNQGVSVARNKGIDEAKAEIIAFLDADDEWQPDHLEILVNLWKKYPKAGAYGTAYLIKSERYPPHVASFSIDLPKAPWDGFLPNYFKIATLGDPPISSSTVAIPKKILEEMKGFSTETWWGEDTDLWGRIALKYPIAFSWDGFGIYYTNHLDRACTKVEPVNENIFIKTARDALRAGNVPEELKSDLFEYVAYKQIQTACRNLAAGRPDLARHNLKNCRTRYLRRSFHWTLLWAYIPSGIFISLKRIKAIVSEYL